MLEKFILDGYFYKIIFSGVDYLPMYEFLYIVLDPYENSIFLGLILGETGMYVFIYFCFTVLLALIFRGMRNLFGYKGFSFNERQDLFHMFFLAIPIVNIIYGVIIGFSNLKIKEQFGPIIFGIIFWGVIFSLRGRGIYSGDTINIFYFFPVILLILFLWKPVKSYLQIGKNVSIILLFGLLLIQPLFTTWFLNIQKPLENKICYSREHARSGDRYVIVGSKCFKIFEGFALYPWMQPIGYTHDELSRIKQYKKLELLLEKQSQIQNPSSLNEDIKKAYKSLLLSEFKITIDDIGNKNSGFLSEVRPFDRDKILKKYEFFTQTYGKDERVEYLYKEFIKNLKYLEK